MKNLIAVFLILFLITPASAFLRTDDSAYDGFLGSPVVKKPSGKYGGVEAHTLTFSGFDGSAPVTVQFTVPDHLAGLIGDAEIYISDAEIPIDWYEVKVRVYQDSPQYTDAECEAFATSLGGGSLTMEEFRALTDAQRRQWEFCYHNYTLISAPRLSHAQTTNQWVNDWSAGISGGTVDSSRVFYNHGYLRLTGPEFSEIVRTLGITDATGRINTATLKNEYPVGSSVSSVWGVFSESAYKHLPSTSYWVLTLGDDEAVLSEAITVKIDLYLY